MQLPDIFLLAALLILLRLVSLKQVRHAAMIICSTAFLFVFQPAVPIRDMGFTLPLLTAALTGCVYASFSTQRSLKTKQNLIESGLILITVLLIAATRFFSYSGIITASRPPQLLRILPLLAASAVLCALLNLLSCRGSRWPKRICIILILAVLVILKTPALSLEASRIARGFSGQDQTMALGTDLRWFGFSYIAFRLLSVLIDTLKGRKADLSIGEFLIYVCFPPALSAGPIDRWDRFTKEYAAGPKNGTAEDLKEGFGQIALGLFHKFILADALSKMALSAQNAGQFIRTGWAWAALFAYSLQIFFDFSGYSEIAVGLGILFGIRLPKNFDHPYLKGDLTKFWSSWHMTLTQWIRSYVFNPLTRSLRSKREHPLPQWLIILITQLTTMLLIGLWHGVSVNFVIWGLWHGIGLFIHQLYSRRTGALLRERSAAFQKVYTVFSTALTILYVSLGWVWFVVPDFAGALRFFGRLFG